MMVQRTKIKELLTHPPSDTLIGVQGWVRTKRVSKNVIFITVNDGSTIHSLQIVADLQHVLANWLPHLTAGTSIGVEGHIVASPGQEQAVELQAITVYVLGTALDYPLQPKKHSFAFLREKAHLRFRTNTFGAVFRLRHALSYAIHQFFHERGFVYLHTPVITSIDAEGAGETFHVTTLDPAHAPRQADGTVDFSQDFFHQRTNLTVSGQLAAEAAALGLAEVYTFGPTFRAENSHTTRHLAEFWMVEPEVAFYDLSALIDLTETFLTYIIRFVVTHCIDDLTWLQQRAAASQPSVPLLERLHTLLAEPFERITYTEAVAILQAARPNQIGEFAYPIRQWGVDLQSEHERYLVEQHFKKPVIVTDYPQASKAFYMRQNDDKKTVAAMDVLFPGVGEIIGGSQREERFDNLYAAMQQFHIAPETLQWYLDTRRFGSVLHSGFGMGLERLVQFVTDMENIRDVIPFPRTPGHAAC